jgi:hypothetical protein
MSQTPPAAQRSPLEALLPFWQQVSYVLIGAGVALALIPAVNILKYEHNNLPLCFWGGALALTFLAAGVVHFTAPRGRTAEADVDTLRLLLLSVLAVSGFVTAVFGLVLPFVQYRAQLAGGLVEWRKNADLLTWCLAAFVGGLVLMFVGLTLGRTYERTQAGLRRLMYGYNAVLTALLLLVILAIANVLCYSPVYPFSKARVPVDWTASAMYTLQPATKNLIASIDKPVKVYVMMPSNSSVSEQSITLLQNCRALNERIAWESVSPQLNQDRYEELATKYQVADYGILVLYGDDPAVQSEVIPVQDLVKVTDRDPMGRPTKSQYTGENAVFKALSYLSQGKARAKVYFTQGNGELDFNDRTGTRKDQGLGQFIEQLSKSNYDLLPLPFDKNALADKKEVPDDADVVVVAGPRLTMPPEGVEALRTYMRKPHGPDKKKGKLIVMLDVVKRNDGTMAPTGLEGLLREFGVSAGNNHILSLAVESDPGHLPVVTNPGSSNPVARAYFTESQQTLFHFFDARTLTAQPAGPEAEGNFTAEELALAFPQFGVWAEEDLNAAATPSALADQLRRDAAKQKQKLSRRPLCVAVAVTESNSAGLPPGHPGMTKDKTPRMVVFGDASWVSNKVAANTNIGAAHADLFLSCLAWLRERPEVGETIATKDRDTYALGLQPGAVNRLERLPTFLMLIGVVTLGGGVWVVRRR